MNKTACYDNRELSWLKFNKRVLEEARDPKVPLAERLSFASIYQSNLDEFFMVRVGSLHDQQLISEDIRENKTHMTSKQQIEAIVKRVEKLNKLKDETYFSIMNELKEYGVELINFHNLSEEDTVQLDEYFEREIRPILSPQIVGKRQPFPFLKNKDIYAVVSMETKNNNIKLGIIPCSSTVFRRLIPMPSDKNRFMLAEELILHYAPRVFHRYKIKNKALMRVTRNADIDEADVLFDEYADYRDVMEELIKRRKKLCAVRLEFSRHLSEDMVRVLCKYLELDRKQVFFLESPLDLSFGGILQERIRDRKELFFQRRVPQRPCMLKNGDDMSMIEQIKQRDLLFSYPFESMQPFIRLLQEAGRDESVVSIKMTLYRVAKNSKVIEALVDAAEQGKEVVVLVELRARFDEENNIGWSIRLEEAGCRIIYGLDGLKVHSKLCLITRKEQDHVSYITQIGTGNYNEITSKIYTDLSLMTASEAIAEEAARVFNSLAIGQVVEETDYLLVAPKCLQNKVIQMIEKEIDAAKRGEKAYIGLKMNSLTDKVIINKLIEASQSGVRIQMAIRGISCLVAGVKGYTDNIEIISIVGRYLEHSRIYIFGGGEREKIYISSADFMTRNTVRRVEIGVPVLDPAIRERIRTMFFVLMSDNVKARVQLPDSSYARRQQEGELINSQEYFYEEAYKKAGGIN